LEFYAEVPSILSELKRRNIHIAAASRTSAPELYVCSICLACSSWDSEIRLTYRAREALGMLLLHDEGKTVKAVSYFNTMEIYPGWLKEAP
jgi:magnesium-dependent phosphatase 1